MVVQNNAHLSINTNLQHSFECIGFLNSSPALLLNRHLGDQSSFKIPAKSYRIFSLLNGILLVSVYDRIIVLVIVRKMCRIGGFTLLRLMGVGILFVALSMFVLGLVEKN